MKSGLRVRRRYGRKRNQKKNKPIVSKSIKKYVSRQLHKNIESKQTNLQEDGVAIPIAEGVGFNQVGYNLLDKLRGASTQGVSQNLVIGDGTVNQEIQGLQFRAQYLEITGTILNNGGSSMVRLFVIQDNQASNATGTLQLYNNTVAFDNLILQTDQFTSPINTFRRFKVLYDRKLMVSDQVNNWKTFKIRINLKNELFKYYPTQLAIPPYTKSIYELNKSLRFYFTSLNQPDGGDPVQPSIQYFSKVVFEDA